MKLSILILQRFKLKLVYIEQRMSELRIHPLSLRKVSVLIRRRIRNVAWRIVTVTVAENRIGGVRYFRILHYSAFALQPCDILSCELVRRNRLLHTVVRSGPLKSSYAICLFIAHYDRLKLVRPVELTSLSDSDYLLWNVGPLLWSFHNKRNTELALLSHRILIQSVYFAVNLRRSLILQYV